MIEELIKVNCEVEVNLKNVMLERKITVNQLSKMTGIRHHIVKKYYKNEMYRIDLLNLAKFCDALNCEIEDILILKRKDI